MKSCYITHNFQNNGVPMNQYGKFVIDYSITRNMIALFQSYKYIIYKCIELSQLLPILVIHLNRIKDFSMDDMFKIATKQSCSFGIEGYEAPKKYVDPIK